MSGRMKKAVDYANTFWSVPCRDGLVWGDANTAINIAQELQALQPSRRNWGAFFLRYRSRNEAHLVEGLYLLPNDDETTIGNRITKNLEASHFSTDRIFLCSWPDNVKDTDPDTGKQSKYSGLNDCTHFVSSCLVDAGIISGPCLRPDELLRRVNPDKNPNAKMLTHLLESDKANLIIDTILTPGDLILFGNPSNNKDVHVHSSLVLETGQVAMHSFANHQDFNAYRRKDTCGPFFNNWLFFAQKNAAHSFITTVHFTFDDPHVFDPAIIGWWKVALGDTSTPFRYYRFERDGTVRWTQVPPSAENQLLINAKDTGHWFSGASDLKICWQGTGSVERYAMLSPAVRTITGASTQSGLLSPNTFPNLKAEVISAERMDLSRARP